jgi:hypothetical protein
VFNQYSIFSNTKYFIQYFKEFNAKKNAYKSDLKLKKMQTGNFIGNLNIIKIELEIKILNILGVGPTFTPLYLGNGSEP